MVDLGLAFDSTTSSDEEWTWHEYDNQADKAPTHHLLIPHDLCEDFRIVKGGFKGDSEIESHRGRNITTRQYLQKMRGHIKDSKGEYEAGPCTSTPDKAPLSRGAWDVLMHTISLPPADKDSRRLTSGDAGVPAEKGKLEFGDRVDISEKE